MIVTRIINQIELLDPNSIYQFITESNSNKIKFISVDSDHGPIRFERILPDGNVQSVTVSSNNLEKLALHIKENIPFSIDAIVGASGNWRAVFESALAYTPEFYHCKLNGQKRLVWCPQNPHTINKLVEIDCATLPKDAETTNSLESIIEEFRYFLENCTKSPNSFRNYYSGLSTVAEYIKKFNPTFSSLLDYTSLTYLEPIYEKLMRDPEFIERDSGPKGGKMYSNAFYSYLMFLRARQYFSKKTTNKGLEKVFQIQYEQYFRPYITAIKSKPFILLAGISGTGKSRIVRELARACYDEDSEEYRAHKPANFEMIQVRPNWHDSTELLGYVSRINGDQYIAGDFLKFIVKAWENPDTPHFLCLDEMNLAPVEQYFAEYLSVIESRKLDDNGNIVTDPILKKAGEQWYVDLIHQITTQGNIMSQFRKDGISIPQNLVVMGTVNMDETTFSFSRKVLDRAMSIEMNEVDLYGGLEESGHALGKLNAAALTGSAVEGKDIYTANKEVCDKVLQYLETINEKLECTPFKVAYRTRNEFLLYVVNNLPYTGEGRTQEEMIATALDEITSMKILSRIEGDESKITRDFLPGLRNAIKGMLNNLSGKEYVENKASGEEDKVLSVSLKKLAEMEKKLQDTGYTSYWC